MGNVQVYFIVRLYVFVYLFEGFLDGLWFGFVIYCYWFYFKWIVGFCELFCEFYVRDWSFGFKIDMFVVFLIGCLCFICQKDISLVIGVECWCEMVEDGFLYIFFQWGLFGSVCYLVVDGFVVVGVEEGEEDFVWYSCLFFELVVIVFVIVVGVDVFFIKCIVGYKDMFFIQLIDKF